MSDTAAHERVLAMSFNNRGWDLWESEERQEEGLHAAHSAYALWDRIGGPIHRMRALVLLGYAHSRLGSPDLALRYARAAEQLLLKSPEGLADWDGPFVLDALARAHESAGEAERAEEYRIVALNTGRKIEAEADRSMFLQTWGRHRAGVTEEAA